LIVSASRLQVAGIMACPPSLSKEGHELQFAVNHLAPFTLTLLLLPLLISSSTPTFQSRIVNVASSSHRYSSVHFDNLSLTGIYTPHGAYGQSKTALIWTANMIERLYGPCGVHAISLNPGGIWTGLQSYSSAEQIAKWKQDEELMKIMQSPEQGSATTLWAAVGKVWEGKGGKYVADCKVSDLADRLDDAINNGRAPWCYDPPREERLWRVSCEITGVQPPKM
jgi:NAD(P)-dependent dehydrogenase (short-subunit alcohol dehydrogenase family)